MVLTFSVTQKPKCFPKINLVWASKDGIPPKKIKVIGNMSHCKTNEIFFNLLNFFGFGGKIKKLIIEEISIPAIDIVIIFLVTLGKLYDKRVILNFSPPKINGSQPKEKINSDATVQDQKPSKIFQE